MSYIPDAYELQDTHGCGQCAPERLIFNTWHDLDEYLDENPDVTERIYEGYAIIKEIRYN